MNFIKNFFITKRLRDLFFNFFIFVVAIYLFASLEIFTVTVTNLAWGTDFTGLEMSDLSFNIFMFSVMGIMIAGYLYSICSKLFKKPR